MKTSQNGIEFISRHEGLRKTAYQDQAGYWTIGYGHLIASGEDYLFGAPITTAQAKELLAADLKTAETAVNRNISVQLNQNQFDALVSLVFNIGSGAFAGSTVLSRINAGDTEPRISEAWKRWDKVTIDGQLETSRGLQKRRSEEVDLYFTDPEKKKIILLVVAICVVILLIGYSLWM